MHENENRFPVGSFCVFLNDVSQNFHRKEKTSTKSDVSNIEERHRVIVVSLWLASTQLIGDDGESVCIRFHTSKWL